MIYSCLFGPELKQINIAMQNYSEIAAAICPLLKASFKYLASSRFRKASRPVDLLRGCDSEDVLCVRVLCKKRRVSVIECLNI